jgi:hypothetical protein
MSGAKELKKSSESFKTAKIAVSKYTIMWLRNPEKLFKISKKAWRTLFEKMYFLLCYDFIVCLFAVKSTVSLIYLNSDKAKSFKISTCNDKFDRITNHTEWKTDGQPWKQECQIDRQKDRNIHRQR